MIKKGVKIFFLVTGMVIIIFCILIAVGVLVEKGILKTEDNTHISVEYTPKEDFNRIDEVKIPDSEYHKTLQEAIDNNGIKSEEGKEYQKRIDEVIKRWENDDYILIFFRSVKNQNEECFTMAKFKKKCIDEKERYVFLTDIPSDYEIDSIYLGDIRENIKGHLKLTDYMQNINIYGKDTRFIYGESRFKEIENLEIEGQKPTGIIVYEVFGETWYFWYYEKFKSDKAGNSLEFTFE